MIPSILEECVLRSSGIFEEFYCDKILDSIKKNLIYAADLRRFYHWLGISIEDFQLGGIYYGHQMETLMQIYEVREGSVEIFNKIVKDLSKMVEEHDQKIVPFELP